MGRTTLWRTLRLTSTITLYEVLIYMTEFCLQVRRKKPMNLAMKYYMEKKRAHDEFIQKERAEFELGKRHLANMMGEKGGKRYI